MNILSFQVFYIRIIHAYIIHLKVTLDTCLFITFIHQISRVVEPAGVGYVDEVIYSIPMLVVSHWLAVRYMLIGRQCVARSCGECYTKYIVER